MDAQASGQDSPLWWTHPLPLVGRGRGWGSGDVALRRPTARPPTPSLPHSGGTPGGYGSLTQRLGRVEAVSPPPGPLTRADLPPPGRGEAKTEVSFLALSVGHDGSVEIGTFGQRIGEDRILQVGALEARAAQVGAVQIGAEQIDPGEDRAAQVGAVKVGFDHV